MTHAAPIALTAGEPAGIGPDLCLMIAGTALVLWLLGRNRKSAKPAGGSK